MNFSIGKDKGRDGWDNPKPFPQPQPNLGKTEEKTKEATKEVRKKLTSTSSSSLPSSTSSLPSSTSSLPSSTSLPSSFFHSKPISSVKSSKTLYPLDLSHHRERIIQFQEDKKLIAELREAISSGDLDSLEMIFKEKDDIFLLNNIKIDGQSLVHLAVDSDQIEVLRFFFELQPELKLNEKDNDGGTPLDLVLSYELNYQWFEVFILNGVPFPKTLDKEEEYYVTTFVENFTDEKIQGIKQLRNCNLIITNIYTFFLENNLLEKLPKLISIIPELIHIKDSQGLTILDKDVLTPMQLAILKKIFPTHLFNQSKVNEGNKQLLEFDKLFSLDIGWLELLSKHYIAHDHSSLNMIIGILPVDNKLRLFIQNELKNSNAQAVTYAAENHWYIVRLILEINGEAVCDGSGKSILHWAVIHNNFDFFESYTLDLYDYQDNSGLTPLLTAAAYKRKDMVLLLIKLGYDTTKTDLNGKTFLDLLEVGKEDVKFFDDLDSVLGKQYKTPMSNVIILLYELKNIDLLFTLLLLPRFASDIKSIFDKLDPNQRTILNMVFPKLECFKSIIYRTDNFNFSLCDEDWLKALFAHAPETQFTYSIDTFLKPNFIDYFQDQIKKGKLDTIQILFDRCNLVQITNFLFVATFNHKWEMVDWLLTKYPLLLTQVDTKGQTIFFRAIRIKNLALINKLIWRSNFVELLAIEDKLKRNPLDFLLEKYPDWVEGIRFFAAKKPKLRERSIKNALEKAISMKNWPATQALLELAEEERKHGMKLYPLHLACKHNATKIVEFLMNEKESLQETDDKGATILHYAYPFLKSYNAPPLDKLKPYFASLINRKDGQGNTPLHLAIRDFHGFAVQELIGMGANVNAQNNMGNTPLHLAASQVIWFDYIEENNIGFLIDKGAGPSRLIKNKDGHTPLHLAAKHGYLINVKALSDDKTLAVMDNQGKTPMALAIENRNYHLIFLLLPKNVQNDWITLQGGYPPGRILSRPSELDPYDSIKDPFGGDFWITNFPGETIGETTLDFYFHDVQFANKTSQRTTDASFIQKMDQLKKDFPESMVRWLVYEKKLREQGYRINPAIYTPQSPIEIPKAPDYADFAYASKTITSMVSRIQNDNPHRPGFINRKIADVQTQLQVFLTDIKDQKLAETITGKKGTPECDQYYKNLISLLIHIAILLSEEKCPIRRKAQAERQSKNLPPLPLFDNGDCATVIGELVRSTRYCGADRAEALIISYELLTRKVQETSSLSKTQQSWEKDVLLGIDQYRETVAQWVIKMQKNPNGREIYEGDEKHIGQQVRSHLKARGVKGGEFSEKDMHAKPYITKEKVEFSFDKFFSMSGLLEFMHAGMNGRIGPDGKRISEFGKEKIIDWLIDNFATPEELQRTQIANQLVAALEKMKDPTTSREEKRKQRKIEETLAKQLGVPEILYKVPSLAYQDAVLLAGETRTRIEKEFHFNDTTFEWGFEGIAKILAHPKIGVLIKETPIRDAEEKKHD